MVVTGVKVQSDHFEKNMREVVGSVLLHMWILRRVLCLGLPYMSCSPYELDHFRSWRSYKHLTCILLKFALGNTTLDPPALHSLMLVMLHVSQNPPNITTVASCVLSRSSAGLNSADRALLVRGGKSALRSLIPQVRYSPAFRRS